MRAVFGTRCRRRKTGRAEPCSEIRLGPLITAEWQCAPDVQVLDVDVVRFDAVVHFGSLARVPELVVAIVPFRVTQLEREREAPAFLEIAIVARVGVFEAAARPVTAVQGRLEQGRLIRPRQRRGEQQCDSEDQCVFQAPVTIAQDLESCHREHEAIGDGYNWVAMRINTDQVSGSLDKGLSPVWLIAGDEALLTGEAADAVRARARAEGYSGRELFITDRSFDWSDLVASTRSLSLFSERRIIEVRMPSPRPGKAGGAALAALAADPGPDNLLLVVMTRPEKDTWSSAWFKSFDKHGIVVQAWPVEIGRLPQWIASRAARHGLSFERDAALLLAERVEGNLLAAHQEIEKLALLHAGGRIGEEEVLAAVANSARYDVFQLGEAALAGDLPRALRILGGLRAEGAEPPLVLWALCRELRALADARTGPQRQAFGSQAERRAELLRIAVRRTTGQPLGPLFAAAAVIDRQIKGIARGKPWTSLTGLVAALARVRLPA